MTACSHTVPFMTHHFKMRATQISTGKYHRLNSIGALCVSKSNFRVYFDKLRKEKRYSLDGELVWTWEGDV